MQKNIYIFACNNILQTMQRLIFFIGIAILFCSCGTSYYYVRLDTSSPDMKRIENGNFVIKDDSVELTYSFCGENAPAEINIHNKMKRTLYIDWTKSYVGINQSDSATIRLGQDGDGPTSIAPESEFRKIIFNLPDLNSRLEKIAMSRFKPKRMFLNNGDAVTMSTVNYTAKNTPYYFNCLLSLHLGSPEAEASITQNNFFVTRVAKADNVNPDKLIVYTLRRGDSFYTKREFGRKFGRVFGETGQVLILAGAITLGIFLL